MRSVRTFLMSGAILGLLSVVAGAFGAHALRERLTVEQLSVFETAVRYQFFHALALLVVGALSGIQPARMLDYSGGLLLAGTLVFSGSLFLVSLAGWRWMGAVTPVGGMLMLAGWALMAWWAWSLR